MWEQLPYVAELEKAGTPTVVIDFEDQDNMLRQEALARGIPNVRFIHASRTLPGPEDVDRMIAPIIQALTSPLTEKEKQTGRWEPPWKRIIFEGTMDEAEAFFHQTEFVPHPVNAQIAKYTDGLPVRVPTEERVAEMLKGTSHRPDEVLAFQTEREDRPKGDPVRFHPMNRTATVEKVAACAVMAGCKPEHLPAVLAIAESGCYIASTQLSASGCAVSGPMPKRSA